MITPPFIMKTSRRGFTLVELLVAMGILVLIFGLLLQISNGVLMATHASQHKLEARAQARMALDALAQDMLCRINRFGGALLVNTTGAPRLALLVESRGYEADSRFVAVNYEHENGEIRQSFNTATWSTASLTSALVTHANTTTLSRGVLRFALMLTLSDGRTVPVREAGEWLSDTVDGKAHRKKNPTRTLGETRPPPSRSIARPRIGNSTNVESCTSRCSRQRNAPAFSASNDMATPCRKKISATPALVSSSGCIQPPSAPGSGNANASATATAMPGRNQSNFFFLIEPPP